MISSYNNSLSCSREMSSLWRSNSKNSGSSGGATGSSSGSCCTVGTESGNGRRIGRNGTNVHKPPNKDEPKHPQRCV